MVILSLSLDIWAEGFDIFLYFPIFDDRWRNIEVLDSSSPRKLYPKSQYRAGRVIINSTTFSGYIFFRFKENFKYFMNIQFSGM